jgi:hypothetical protein
VDLLDGTPILDVKPYLPYSDAIPDAVPGYARDAPQPNLPVRFAAQPLRWFDERGDDDLRALIIDVLALDPRPAYRDRVEPDRRYGMRLAGHEIGWRVDADGVEVVSVGLPRVGEKPEAD